MNSTACTGMDCRWTMWTERGVQTAEGYHYQRKGRITCCILPMLLLMLLEARAQLSPETGRLLPTDKGQGSILETLDEYPYGENVAINKIVARADKELMVKYEPRYKTFLTFPGTNTGQYIRKGPIPEPGTPWPMPQSYNQSDTMFHVHPGRFSMHLDHKEANCDIIDFNFRRITRYVFLDYDKQNYREDPLFSSGSGHDPESSEPSWISLLTVTVPGSCEGSLYPYLNMDESYELHINSSGAYLVAPEVWGAVRGLETFGQLVHVDDHGKFIVNKADIEDYPRFTYRGVLVDTARHFISKAVLLDNLELMAMNKMNAFHWHIVDDQSFPYQSRVFPDLTKYGAYDPDTQVYSHEDIAEVVQRARLLGIRVIPEFDTPGHTFAWGFSQDFLLTDCYMLEMKELQFAGFYGPLNPILTSTYDFLRKLFEEILSVFEDKYVHLGGDEVPLYCWDTNPYVHQYMSRNNLSRVSDLLHLYETKLLDIVTDLGKNRTQGSGSIVWEDVFQKGHDVGKELNMLKMDTIVQFWQPKSIMDNVLKAGFRVIYSSCWYLDATKNGADWINYYACPEINVEEAHSELLLGGEACVWTEYVDDVDVLSRLWPRASAAAERLWSSPDVSSIGQAAPRLEEHRCRMIRQGFPIAVAGGPGYCTKLKNYPLGRRDSRCDFHLRSSGAEQYEESVFAFKDDKIIVTISPVHLGFWLLLAAVIVLGISISGAFWQNTIVSLNLSQFRLYFALFGVFVGVWTLWTITNWNTLYAVRNSRET